MLERSKGFRILKQQPEENISTFHMFLQAQDYLQDMYYKELVESGSLESIVLSNIFPLIRPVTGFTGTYCQEEEVSELSAQSQSTQIAETFDNSWVDIQNIDLHKRWFVDTIIDLMNEVVFEYGRENAADRFVQECLEKSPSQTKEWLNEVFLVRLGDVKVATGILRVIAHLDYDDTFPSGPTMALAAGMHENAEVRECGIRAFENWGNPESLEYLRHIQCGEKWLQDYLNEVMRNLEVCNAIRQED